MQMLLNLGLGRANLLSNTELYIRHISKTVAGECSYASGDTCEAISSYEATIANSVGLVSYEWIVGGATIISGQGTDTLAVSSSGNSETSFTVELNVTDDVGTDTLTISDTHVRTEEAGPALGDEIIINGDFASAVGWTLSAGYSISSGMHIHDGTGSNYSSGNQSISLEEGETYQVEIDMTECDDFTKCGFRFGTDPYTKWTVKGVSTLGISTFEYVATNKSSGLFRLYGMNGYAFKNNNISIRKKL